MRFRLLRLAAAALLAASGAPAGALATRWYVRSVSASDDGDVFAPWSAIIVGGGSGLGALGGLLVGAVAHEATR